MDLASNDGYLKMRLQVHEPPDSHHLRDMAWSGSTTLEAVNANFGSTRKFLDLSGRGACALGDIRIDIDKAYSTDRRFTIEWGILIGMLHPPKDDLAIGFYETAITDAEENLTRIVSGFWRNIPDKEATSVPSQPST